MTDNIPTLAFEGETITALKVDTAEPVFVAAPIAKKLGYESAKDMLRNLDVDEKGRHIVPTLGGPQEMSVITFPGLSHALNNRRPGAIKDLEVRAMVIRFQRWINHDLVPAVTRHGIYATDATIDRIIADPDFGIRLLSELKDERAKRREAENTVAVQSAQLEAQKPKVLFAESVETSPDSIMLGGFAHDLQQNGIPIGRNRLFQWMRDNGYLYKCGELKNEPKQEYVEQGLFEVKTSPYRTPNGVKHTGRTTKLTGKGRIYFTQKLSDSLLKESM